MASARDFSLSASSPKWLFQTNGDQSPITAANNFLRLATHRPPTRLAGSAPFSSK
jgi:hypothetical protein